MNLQDYRDDFYTYSGKASDISRQLAFAGIAIIWIFKKEVPATGLTVPRELILPGILIVLALGVDLLQYCLATVIWWLFYRKKEREGVHEDSELDHSFWLEVPINLAFWVKIISVGGAYVFIFKFLLRTLSFT
jgi:hypothetical protein